MTPGSRSTAADHCDPKQKMLALIRETDRAELAKSFALSWGCRTCGIYYFVDLKQGNAFRLPKPYAEMRWWQKLWAFLADPEFKLFLPRR